TQVRLTGLYRVGKVDTTAPDGFRVTLIDVKTGEEISASLIDAIISAEHRDAIQAAEWNKQPVLVELTARKLRKRIVDAVVIDARHANPPPDGSRHKVRGGASGHDDMGEDLRAKNGHTQNDKPHVWRDCRREDWLCESTRAGRKAAP